MNSVRNALSAGILYTIPLLGWLLGSLYSLTTEIEIRTLFETSFALLILIQAMVITLFIPCLSNRTPIDQALIATTLLLAIPWPLMALFHLASVISLPLIFVGQTTLLVWALLLLATTRIRVLHAKNITAPLVQIIGVTMTLAGSGPWLEWCLQP